MQWLRDLDVVYAVALAAACVAAVLLVVGLKYIANSRRDLVRERLRRVLGGAPDDRSPEKGLARGPQSGWEAALGPIARVARPGSERDLGRLRELNMTNEGRIDGTYRLLKNIMGLWLVLQCKRSFDAAGRKYDYAQLATMAAKARPTSIHRQSQRPTLPQSAGHAGGNPGVLPRDKAANSED